MGASKRFSRFYAGSDRAGRDSNFQLMGFSRFYDTQNSVSEPTCTVYWYYVVNIRLLFYLSKFIFTMTHWFLIQYRDPLLCSPNIVWEHIVFSLFLLIIIPLFLYFLLSTFLSASVLIKLLNIWSWKLFSMIRHVV